MVLKCGILGLPNVGKTTLFNALMESNKAEVANYPFATIEPNFGRVLVPDKRVNQLSEISGSKKVVPTYIDFVDIAGLIKGASHGEGLGNKFLNHIREVDALVHVVRCFENENITHISSNVNPEEDIDTIKTEIKLADIEILQNKLTHLQKKSKSNNKEIKIQLDLVNNLLERLNNDQSINSSAEQKISNDLNLITNKPTLYICNVDEKSIINGNNLSDIVQLKSKKEGNHAVLVSAAIESQIAQLNNERDKIELLYDLGTKETTLNKVINSCYNLLNLITFFTSENKETRAWTIKKNATAIEAAGKIHSDFKKGFIRAETISYDDFVHFKGDHVCREKGKLRQEGKEYIVKDGDVFHFLFNV